jgi:glucokinase
MSEVLPRRTRASRWEPLTVGIDIGGTKVLGAVVDPHGEVLAVDRRPTEGHDVRKVEDTIVDLVADFGREYDVAAVGIGAAGFVDVTRTVVMFSPHLDWRREPLRARVAERVRLPVVVDNDANTMALAECRFGAGRGHRFVLCVTLGTGIGGALVLDQRVYRGANGMAGEFGHMQVVPDGRPCQCGRRGCWEQYCSGRALARAAEEEGSDLSGPALTTAAYEGDLVATSAYEQVAYWLGVGAANLTAAFDPEVIVVGGGVSAAGELLLEPARASMATSLVGAGFRDLPELVGAELGPLAGVIGVADLARTAGRIRRVGRWGRAPSRVVPRRARRR